MPAQKPPDPAHRCCGTSTSTQHCRSTGQERRLRQHLMARSLSLLVATATVHPHTPSFSPSAPLGQAGGRQGNATAQGQQGAAGGDACSSHLWSRDALQVLGHCSLLWETAGTVSTSPLRSPVTLAAPLLPFGGGTATVPDPPAPKLPHCRLGVSENRAVQHLTGHRVYGAVQHLTPQASWSITGEAARRHCPGEVTQDPPPSIPGADGAPGPSSLGEQSHRGFALRPRAVTPSTRRRQGSSENSQLLAAHSWARGAAGERRGGRTGASLL